MTLTEHAATSRHTASTPAPDGGNPSQNREPIAIVGMACRFPQADDLDGYWNLLAEGRDAVREIVPVSGTGRMASLFPGEVENPACRYGAYVDGIELFDAGFFRISPAEAEMLDPQQRMMLEMSWLALEDAGINPLELKGSNTGVYTGISNDEYRMLIVDSARSLEAAGSLYALSGTNLNGCSGRVSFFLGLTGPAKAVDAACASALVAVHDAVADLQQSRADLAIAGGVQAIMNPRINEFRAASMMLSPDGKCKTFDASADGYVRGEGCGVVVLKRLKDAEADGDRIWGVIRGAAMNHGGAAVGLTVPHTPALEQVMQAALADAGVSPLQVDFLEAHGTGTPVGDPIELNAVASVYGKGRKDGDSLLIGSSKTNIGHAESAAGIAGLIKAMLALKRGVIPKHLHFHNPTPSIDWENSPLKVTTSTMDWPRRGNGPRVAGVNSFGISGTNAHIVVEEYRNPNGESGAARETANFAPRETRFLPLSGKTEEALSELAKRYLSWLDEQSNEFPNDASASDPMLSDMSWTAGVGRGHFEHRAGVTFDDVKSLRERVSAVAEAGTESETRKPSKIAFVYTGQGSQWVGMGKTLYETEPVFKAVLDRCEKVFQQERGASLLDVMFGREGAHEDLGDTAWEQPALYALECALTALWSSAGVRPAVALGHSVGEIAAAQAAGVFTLEDGMRFAATRGTLLGGTERGAMAAVFAPAARVASAVEEFNSSTDSVGLSVSGDNGAHQVISGPIADVETLSNRFESEGIRAVRLNTKWAFHSAMVEPRSQRPANLPGWRDHRVSKHRRHQQPHGQPIEPSTPMDGAYWRRHAREPVAFASGVRALAGLDVDAIIEIGPHSVLGPMAQIAWPDDTQDAPPSVLSTLRRPPKDAQPMSPKAASSMRRRRLTRPGWIYPSKDYSLEKTGAGFGCPATPSSANDTGSTRPVSGAQAAGIPARRAARVRPRRDYLRQRSVPVRPGMAEGSPGFRRLVAPGALYGAIAALASRNGADETAVVEDFQLHSPLVFTQKDDEHETGEQGRKIQAVIDNSDESSARRFQLFSKGGDQAWRIHVEGRVSSGPPTPGAAESVDLEAMKSRLSPANPADYYRAKADTGIDLGPFFRTLRRCWAGPNEALAEITFPDALGENRLDVHPLMLDGCFQVVGVARNMKGGPDEPTYLPFGWDRFWLNGRMPDRIFCHVVMSDASAETESTEPAEVLSGELRIYEPDGTLIGVLSGYAVKQATRAALFAAIEGEEGISDLLYEVVWRESPLESAVKPADFFPTPAAVAAGTDLFPDYLLDAGVDPDGRNALLADLERWSHSYALATLQKLGWNRKPGEIVNADELRQRLEVLPEHSRLFRRMFEMLARSGVVEEQDGSFAVVLGPDDPLPGHLPNKPQEFHQEMAEMHPDGQVETGLFRRSGDALADVLRGKQDPLTLLFSSGEPTAADLYLKAPVARAANEMLAHAVRILLSRLAPVTGVCACWKWEPAPVQLPPPFCLNCRPAGSATHTRTYPRASSRKRRRGSATATAQSNTSPWTSKRIPQRRASIPTDTT